MIFSKSNIIRGLQGLFYLLATFAVPAQSSDYVVSGVVYGNTLGKPEKDVYVVAYRVKERSGGFAHYEVPSAQHALFTSGKGAFKLVLDAAESYMIEFAKEGYAAHKLDFSPKEGVAGKEIGIEVALEQGQSLLFATEYVDANTKAVLPAAHPIITDSLNKTRKVGVTDKYGKCYFVFEDRESNVILQAYRPGYFWSEKEKLQVSRKASGRSGNKSRELEPIQIGKWMPLPKFYFAINDEQLQPEGKEALKPLYQLMRDNPGLRVEIASHTDARGDDIYNKLLSQKRADAAVNHLVRLGISPTRLRPMGYGEEKLLNECGNGVRCDNKRHAQNRRMAYMVYEIVE